MKRINEYSFSLRQSLGYGKCALPEPIHKLIYAANMLGLKGKEIKMISKYEDKKNMSNVYTMVTEQK